MALCLAPTYHRAYDLGIIYIDDRYVVKANDRKLDQLRVLNLNGGGGKIRASLGPLSLPRLRQIGPRVDMIRQANAFRGIAV